MGHQKAWFVPTHAHTHIIWGRKAVLAACLKVTWVELTCLPAWSEWHVHACRRMVSTHTDTMHKNRRNKNACMHGREKSLPPEGK